MPAELDFHHSFETCGVNWRLVSLCKAFILKITRMLFTAMCYNQSFTFSYKILCKLQGAKKPSTSVYHSRTKTFSKYYAQPRNDSIYDRSADTASARECTIHKRLAFSHFNSKFARSTMQFLNTSNVNRGMLWQRVSQMI